MPLAAASSRAGLRASGSFGLNTIAFDVLGDQVADVGELARGVSVPVDHGHVGDFRVHLDLGLGGADLLLAEAVAHATTVGVAERVGRGRSRRRCGGRCGCGRGRGSRGRGSRGGGRGAGRARATTMAAAATKPARRPNTLRFMERASSYPGASLGCCSCHSMAWFVAASLLFLPPGARPLCSDGRRARAA